MITVHDVEQGTPEWHALRDGKYTGSNADKLLAYSGQIKYVNGVASAYALTEITGFGGTFYTKRGHILEDEAVELYEAIYKRRPARPGFITNSDFPTCGYSPDGIDGVCGSHACSGILLEVKCFTVAKHLAIVNGQIPRKILAQIHFGLLICGLRVAKLIVYNPELDPKLAFKVIEVRHNRNIASNFRKILKEVKDAQPTTITH